MRISKLFADLIVAHLGEVAMGNGVISDFMALRDNSSHDLRMGFRVCRHNVERCFYIPFLQYIEEARGVNGVRPIVKCECDKGKADIHAGIRIPRSDGSGKGNAAGFVPVFAMWWLGVHCGRLF